MNTLVIIIAAALLITFILWWFFGNHKSSQALSSIAKDNSFQKVVITVDGGYKPAIVVLKKGVPATIVFDRKDSSGCFNEVVFPDFGIHETLAVDQKNSIKLNTDQAGEYQYACGMNMFFGKVIIK